MSMAAIKGFIFKLSLLMGNKIDLGDISTDDDVVLVIGPSGAGKSEFIYLASGTNKDEIGHGLGYTTKKVKGIKCPLDGEPNRSVILVDTPGINLDLSLVQQIPDQCSKLDISIAGILYLHPLVSPRENENPGSHFSKLRTLCGGREDLQKALLVTTNWQPPSDRKTSTHIELENKFRGTGTFRDVVKFDRTPQSAWEIISQLLHKSSEME